MNVLFRSPMGAVLARPWVDGVALTSLRRWYLPLSRLWAAANAAGDDPAAFRSHIGAAVVRNVWPERFVRRILQRNRAAQGASMAARSAWEEGIFTDNGLSQDDARRFDWRRRAAATRHLAMRGAFYPLLFPERAPTARWQIVPPAEAERDFGSFGSSPAKLYAAAPSAVDWTESVSFECGRVRESWLRAPTPAPRLQLRAGSEMLYARVVEPLDRAAHDTVIFGSGLGLENELVTYRPDGAVRLAELGWRSIEPISPYHGLRAMPGFYGGEPFFAQGPTSAIDLIAGQTTETAALIGWARRRYGGKVAVAGISMTSFVAQQVASYCAGWPAEAQPDAVLLVSHSGRVEDVAFGGELAAALGLDRALIEAGWSAETLAKVSQWIDPADEPALAPVRIVSVLGETDRWVPYQQGLGLAQQWKLPERNIFRYRLGHLGMPVQLFRDDAPFVRLSQVLSDS